jgi:hypothetical protein
MSSGNNVNGISMSMKSTQSFSVTAFQGGPTPAPAGNSAPPATPGATPGATSSASASQTSLSSPDVQKLAGELKAIASEMGNKPTCGCAGKSPAPTTGASPAPTSGAPAGGTPPPGGAPVPGGADKAGAPGQAGQPGKAGGKKGKGFQQMMQKMMQMLQNAMKQFGMKGA